MGLFDSRDHRHLSQREHLDHKFVETGENPTPQPGFEGSIYGMQRSVPVERWQGVLPPTDLGRAASQNHSFIVRNNDLPANADTFGETGNGRFPKWNPLWKEREHLERAKQLRYEWDTMTPHGSVENVLLFQNNRTQASRPAPNVIPTVPPAYTPHKIKKLSISGQ